MIREMHNVQNIFLIFWRQHVIHGVATAAVDMFHWMVIICMGSLHLIILVMHLLMKKYTAIICLRPDNLQMQ